MFFERTALPALTAFWLLASCTVLENRDGCPCRLDLFFTGEHLPAVLVLDTEEGRVIDSVKKAGIFRINVPRGEVRLLSCSGDGGLFNPAAGLVIAEGSGCPPVYMAGKIIRAGEEYVSDTVRLRKNHCRITMRVNPDWAFWSDMRPPVLKGRVCGYDAEGSPSRGAFSCEAREASALEYVCFVPRQADDSMILEIRDREGTLRTFALGLFIAASGYDWNRPDLEDIEMNIDYSRTEVGFTVMDWTATVPIISMI